MTDYIQVYGEDLYNAGNSGVVKAQGNMGGLVVRLFAINDATSFKATTVTVKQGDDSSSVTSDCVSFTTQAVSNVKAGQLIGEVMLPWDVSRYVTATVSGTGEGGAGGETANACVTLGYLPR